MSGLKIAALYGFYPHKLGFCGLQEKSAKEALFKYLSGREIFEQEIRKILETFLGAFPYFKLIARINGIKDPFDEKVVQAYWIGNELLEKVSSYDLSEMIVKEFSVFLSEKIAQRKAKAVPFDCNAHHSFHVLFMGSVTGTVELEGKLLDFCRVGWGRVKEFQKKKDKDGLIVEYQFLRKENDKFFLEEPRDKFVFWDKEFVPGIEIGDVISTHWGYVVGILDGKDLDNLKKYTWNTISSLNNT